MLPCASAAMPRGLSRVTCVGVQPAVAVGAQAEPPILPAKLLMTPLGAMRRTMLATASVRYTLPKGSAVTLRRSTEPPKTIDVAGQPSPKLSVALEQLALAPPASVVMV